MDYNILDFGAKSGTETLSTNAIQATIDACALTGGRVIIPAGEYLTGTLRLRSHVELHISHGARLVASTDLADYNAIDEFEQNQRVSSEGWGGYHLIMCVEQEDVAITGTGVIDGRGEFFFNSPTVNPVIYPWRRGAAEQKPLVRPGQLVCFVESRDIVIKDITIKNSPSWTCLLHGCENVNVRGIKILNPYYHYNTDGLDIDTCRSVCVSDCIIDAGDDAIAIRGASSKLKNKGGACEHVVITNCTLSSNSSAIRIGVGTSPIRHVRVSNITIRYAGVGINFFPEWAQTSHTPISDVHFTGVSATDVGRMIELNVNNGTPISCVTVSDVVAEAMSAARIRCTSPGAVRGLKLSGLHITAIKDIDAPASDAPEHRGSEFFLCEGIDDLCIRDCALRIDETLLTQWSAPSAIRGCTGEHEAGCGITVVK